MAFRIHQLARQTGVDRRPLIRLLRARGYEVKNASSTIDNISAEAIVQELKQVNIIMAKLYRYSNPRKGYYVKGAFRQNGFQTFITYQVTPDGVEILRRAGLKPEDDIPRKLFERLRESGHLYTGGSGAEAEPEAVDVRQPEIPSPANFKLPDSVIRERVYSSNKFSSDEIQDNREPIREMRKAKREERKISDDQPEVEKGEDATVSLLVEMPYLYLEGYDAQVLASRFLVAPDFAATISNEILTCHRVSAHPLIWSRNVPDRNFLEHFRSDLSEKSKYYADLKILNSRLNVPLFNKITVGDWQHGKLTVELTANDLASPSWKWVIEHYDELKEIFSNTPFFHLRLGCIKTDKAFIDADKSFVWPDASFAHSPELSEFSFQNEKGLLGSMGYHVGEHAAPEGERRQILVQVFEAHQLNFPEELPDRYKNGWGLANSAQRLKKIADSICHFAKSFVAQRGTEYAAVEHWRSDLQWLKATYYEPSFKFEWPKLPESSDDPLTELFKSFKAKKSEEWQRISQLPDGQWQQALGEAVVRYADE